MVDRLTPVLVGRSHCGNTGGDCDSSGQDRVCGTSAQIPKAAMPAQSAACDQRTRSNNAIGTPTAPSRNWWFESGSSSSESVAKSNLGRRQAQEWRIRADPARRKRLDRPRAATPERYLQKQKPDHRGARRARRLSEGNGLRSAARQSSAGGSKAEGSKKRDHRASGGV